MTRDAIKIYNAKGPVSKKIMFTKNILKKKITKKNNKKQAANTSYKYNNNNIQKQPL